MSYDVNTRPLQQGIILPKMSVMPVLRSPAFRGSDPICCSFTLQSLLQLQVASYFLPLLIISFADEETGVSLAKLLKFWLLFKLVTLLTSVLGFT